MPHTAAHDLTSEAVTGWLRPEPKAGSVRRRDARIHGLYTPHTPEGLDAGPRVPEEEGGQGRAGAARADVEPQPPAREAGALWR